MFPVIIEFFMPVGRGWLEELAFESSLGGSCDETVAPPLTKLGDVSFRIKNDYVVGDYVLDAGHSGALIVPGLQGRRAGDERLRLGEGDLGGGRRRGVVDRRGGWVALGGAHYGGRGGAGDVVGDVCGHVLPLHLWDGQPY